MLGQHLGAAGGLVGKPWVGTSAATAAQAHPRVEAGEGSKGGTSAVGSDHCRGFDSMGPSRRGDGRQLGVESSQTQAMERWDQTDRPGARRRGRRVFVTRPESNPASTSRVKKERWAKEPRFPKNSRLVDLLCDNHEENQQQRQAVPGEEVVRCRQRMAKDGMGGVGNLRQRGWVSFLPSPRAGGSGPPGKRELPNRHHSPSPHVCPHPLISTPHPTPHIECRRDFWHPPLFVFSLFSTRGGTWQQMLPM